MKAFMSEPWYAGNWWRQGKGSIPQWDLQAQAMREVTRILAHAEPMRPGYRMADRCYLGPILERRDGYTLTLPGGADVALREALAAFIRDE